GAKTSYGPRAAVMTDPLAPSTTATASRPSGTGLAGGRLWPGVACGARGEAVRIDTPPRAVPPPASQAADSPTPRRRRARRRSATRLRTALEPRLVIFMPHLVRGVRLRA